MNDQARRRIQVGQRHYLFRSTRHVESVQYFTYDDVEHYYDVNTPIATVRCFWQHVVSSTVPANLVNIRLDYSDYEDGEYFDFVENVTDRHTDGAPVTVGYLAGLGTPNVDYDPDYRLLLCFDYVVGNVDNEPHCICNL